MDHPANEKTLPQVITTTGRVPVQGGLMSGFLVATGTPTITLYDGTDNTGRLILNGLVTVAGTFYRFPAFLEDGLYAVITGTCSITFFG